MTDLPPKEPLAAMTQEQIRQAVEEGMQHFFTKLGLDVSSPEAVIEAQQDISFLRRMRKASSSVVSRAVGFITFGVMGALGTLLVMGWNNMKG